MASASPCSSWRLREARGTQRLRDSAARNFSRRNFPARPRRAPPLVTPPACGRVPLACPAAPRSPTLPEPRCPRQPRRPHPPCRSAPQPPPGILVTCAQAAEQVCWASLVRLPARCTHPSAMVSAAAEDALGACCRASGWRSTGWGRDRAQPGLAWRRAGPRTMVSFQPASSGHLSLATWTSGQTGVSLLLREASCPHLPTMLCLPIGRVDSSLGRRWGTLLPFAGLAAREEGWEQGLMPKMDCADAGI